MIVCFLPTTGIRAVLLWLSFRQVKRPLLMFVNYCWPPWSHLSYHRPGHQPRPADTEVLIETWKPAPFLCSAISNFYMVKTVLFPKCFLKYQEGMKIRKFTLNFTFLSIGQQVLSCTIPKPSEVRGRTMYTLRGPKIPFDPKMKWLSLSYKTEWLDIQEASDFAICKLTNTKTTPGRISILSPISCILGWIFYWG